MLLRRREANQNDYKIRQNSRHKLHRNAMHRIYEKTRLLIPCVSYAPSEDIERVCTHSRLYGQSIHPSATSQPIPARQAHAPVHHSIQRTLLCATPIPCHARCALSIAVNHRTPIDKRLQSTRPKSDVGPDSLRMSCVRYLFRDPPLKPAYPYTLLLPTAPHPCHSPHSPHPPHTPLPPLSYTPRP